MSSEETDQPEPTVQGDDVPTDPPAPDPTTEDPTDPDTPPAPDLPDDPIVFEPFMYYSVTSVCSTPTCPNLNTETTEPMVYSNAGTVNIFCGMCSKRRPILAATKLDPQPEVS